MLDRHMNDMDRFLFASRDFHGHLITAEYRTRAGLCCITSALIPLVQLSLNPFTPVLTGSMVLFITPIGFTICSFLLLCPVSGLDHRIR